MFHLHQRVLRLISPGTTATNSSHSPQRAFPCPPPPLPKREDWPQRRIELQPECMFLTKLPPEIRLMVYENVDWGEELARPDAPRSFDDMIGIAGRGDYETNEDEEREEQEENRNSKDQPLEKLRQTPHPLSLLLTSRQINREATPIAYANHTFTTTPHLNFLHALQHATSLLSAAQLEAISSLAYKFPQPPGWHITTPTHFLANALIHFPGLTRVTVIMQRVAEETMPPETVAKETYNDLDGVRGTCHVPVWWDDILSRVVSGSVVRWQSGSKWSLHYTEDETPLLNTTPRNVDEETGKCYLTTVQWILRRCAELGLERPSLPPQPGVLQRRICASRVRLPPPKIRGDVEYGSKVRRRDVLVGTRAEVRQEGSGRRVGVGLEVWEGVRVERGVWAPSPGE